MFNIAAAKITEQIDDLNTKWNNLQQASEERANQLASSYEVQRFGRDIEETRDWIAEKDKALDNDNLGNNLKEVSSLKRKFEGFQKDLAALEGKIRKLDDTANRLMQSHPEQAEQTYEKQTEINREWTMLNNKALTRENNLKDSYELQKFLADAEDIKNWINSIKNKLQTDEEPTDVLSAEAALDRHADLHTEMDARNNAIRQFELNGRNLFDNGHYASPLIQDKLNEVNQARDQLEQLWNEKRDKLDQCLELQLFYRDCQQGESYMDSREAFISESGDTEQYEFLIKKHADFNKSIAIHQQKIDELGTLADQLKEKKHYAAPEIEKKKQEVLERWESLKNAMIEKRFKIGETQSLQEWCSDAGIVNDWIAEKLQVALDEGYKDPSAIQTTNAKTHDAFESELEANKERIENLIKNGNKLVESRQCADSEGKICVNII